VIRVLVAEDSAAARGLIAAILESDPDVQVVGRAADGAEAVRLVHLLSPDVVTMDIHMPVMDGLKASGRIMYESPVPIVIVSATTRVRDQHLSLEALRAGAVALIAKPEGPTSPRFERDAAELLATVKAMASVKVVRHRLAGTERAAAAARAIAPPPSAAPTRTGGQAPRIVAIAGSTGAPAGLQEILAALTPDLPVPIAIVQHMAIGFTAALAQWLDGASPIDVALARDAETLRPGRAVIAPDDRHLLITPAGTVRLSAADPEGGFRPSASTLFRSAADACGAGVVAVILSGMGKDGVEGLQAVHAKGGHVIAQDEATSVVFGMPGEAVRAGVTDAVLPLREIGPYVRRVVEGAARR
jgi:two-component system chemotaxis response regulator CheB